MRLRPALLVMILSVAFLGACGGGGDDESSSGTALSSDSGDPDTGAVGAFTAARCADALRGMAEAAAAVPQAFSGTNNETLQDSIDRLDEAANAAPSEIRADMQIVADGYKKIVSILVDANFDPASGQAPSQETIQTLEEASAEVDSAEFKAAADRVQAWFQDECGR